MGLHKDLIGADLHVNKLHAETHMAGGTDPLMLAESQVTGLVSHINSLRPFAAPIITGSYDIPASIDATGTTDVSTALINFIASVPDGSLINFPSAAVYRIDKAIQFTGRHNLIIDGNGCTLKYTSVTGTSEAYSLWRDLGTGSDIWIRNFVLIGSSPYPGVYTPGTSPTGGEWQFGVVVRSDRFEVSGCTISAMWGDGLYVVTSPTDVWIHDNHVVSVGRNGLTIISGTNVIAERNAFDKSGYMAFDVEPNVAEDISINIIFRNNTVGTWGHYFFGVVGNPTSSTLDGIVVDGNTVTGSSLFAYVDNRGGERITRITFIDNTGKVAASGPILVFEHVDGLTVAGNVQSLTLGALTSITDCTGVNDAWSELQTQIDSKLAFTPANLITNGEFETNVTGWTNNSNATLSQETGAPLVGAGSLKILVTANAAAWAYFPIATIVGHIYRATCLAKSTAAAGRLCTLNITGGAFEGTPIDCSAGATPLSFTFTATATSHPIVAMISSALADEYLLVDSVVCYDLTGTTATVADINKLHSATAALKLSALNTAPANAGATGTRGEIRITADGIFVCTATNTWVKTALATWA